MSDWTHGYMAEINYTYGYYNELNPVRLAIPFLNAGFAPPEIRTACELGFGQGLSLNIHAAASDVQWYGTDFNPGQAAFARSLAAVTESGAQAFDLSFAEFAARTDLPDFDFIGIHGIFSWISEDNQRVIVDFIRRKLRAGGVIYISYNCQPGHAATLPLRQLLAEHAEVMAAPGRGILNRVNAAFEFVDQLLALNPGFVLANPTIPERVRRIKEQDRTYVAHEYFNRYWRAMPFAETAEWLEGAKLSYACSAAYLDHVDALNMSGEQNRFLLDIPDPMFRQTVRDFMINQQFRRDFWVKGGRRLSPPEVTKAVRAQRIVLTTARSEVSLQVTGALGPREMTPRAYEPILDSLADGKPKSLGDIERTTKDADLSLATIYEAVLVLAGKGDIAPVQSEALQAKAKPHTDKLNRHAIASAPGSAEVQFLASPLTGGGIAVPRIQQLFLLARTDGRKTPEEMGRDSWDLLSSQNERLLKDGKALETPDENLAELTRQAQEFCDKRLPVLQALQVVD